MQLYQKYIFKNLLTPFLIILMVFVASAWLIQSVRYLDFIANKGARKLDFLVLTFHLLPFLIFIVLPIALFFSVYYVFNKLITDKELIILSTLGLKKIKPIKIFIYFTLLIIIFHYIISLYILPISTKKFRELKEKIEQSSFVNLILYNTFITKFKDITIFIEKKGEENSFENIFIFDKNKNAYIAHKANLQKINNDYFLELFDGSILTYNIKKNKKSLTKFDSHHYNLNFLNQNMKNLRKDLNEYSVYSLLTSKFSYHSLNKGKAYGHFRITWPLISFSVILLTLFLLRNKIEQDKIYHKKADWHVFASVFLIIATYLTLHILSYKNIYYGMLSYVISLMIPTIIIYYMVIETRRIG